LFYIFVYALGLKRRTPSNIVIGGAAGCFPVLVGWAAVIGSVSWPVIMLFAVIFLWTPPHFWALAMKFKDDYAAARVPMLPVVASASTVARKILTYSYAMVAVTLALSPGAGWQYGCCAVALGAWFLADAHRLRARVAAGPDAAVPHVDYLPHNAVHRRRSHCTAAMEPLVNSAHHRACSRVMALPPDRGEVAGRLGDRAVR
jgi:heme o synthase